MALSVRLAASLRVSGALRAPLRQSPCKRAGSLLAALVALLVGALDAHSKPACSPAELEQSAKNVYKTVPKQCATHTGNPVFYALTAYLIAFTQTPIGKKFCAAAQQAKVEGDKAKNKLLDLFDMLDEEQQKALKEKAPALGEGASTAQDGLDALSLVSCACTVAQWDAPADLYVELSNCVADGVCHAQDWVHDNLSSDFATCTGPPPQPPQKVDCGVDPRVKDGAFYALGKPYVGFNSGNSCKDPGYVCLGSICYAKDLVAKSASTPFVGSNNYCYCPPHMQQMDWFEDGSGCINFLKCACPSGTKPLSDKGNGAYICVCDKTGLPPEDDGSCAKPVACSCPPDEVVLAKDAKKGTCTCGCAEGKFKLGDKCVAPCSKEGNAMMADGACCPPSSATTCGTCCPPSMKLSDDGTTCVAFSLNETKKPKGFPQSKSPTKPIKF